MQILRAWMIWFTFDMFKMTWDQSNKKIKTPGKTTNHIENYHYCLQFIDVTSDLLFLITIIKIKHSRKEFACISTSGFQRKLGDFLPKCGM